MTKQKGGANAMAKLALAKLALAPLPKNRLGHYGALGPKAGRNMVKAMGKSDSFLYTGAVKPKQPGIKRSSWSRKAIRHAPGTVTPKEKLIANSLEHSGRINRETARAIAKLREKQ